MNVSPARWLARLIDLLVRYRFPILAVAVLTSLLSVYPATQLKFNQSIESLYADATRLHALAQDAGVAVTFDVAPGHQHVFPLQAGHLAAADSSIATMADWYHARRIANAHQHTAQPASA